MNEFPKKEIYILSFLAIIVYMLIDFRLNGNREFPQLNFDWHKEELIKSHGNCKLISLTHNTVSLGYKKELNDLEHYNTLKIKGPNNETCYFRYEYKLMKDNIVQLKGGVWLTQQPKHLNHSMVSVSEVYVPMIKNGNVNVCLVSVSDNKWGWIRSLKKDVKQKNKNINFIGPVQNVYGYSYMPIQLNKKLEFVSENSLEFPNVDVYIVFIESIKVSKNIEVWHKFISQFVEKGAMIYLNTLPELNERVENNDIKKINTLIHELSLSNDNIKILELDEQNGVKGTLSENGNYALNNFGYQLYKELILEQIESTQK